MHIFGLWPLTSSNSGQFNHKWPNLVRMRLHLVSPALEAGQRGLLSQRLQHSVHSLGPVAVRVQAGTQGHSAILWRTEHLLVPWQKGGDQRRDPTHLHFINHKSAAGAAAGACGDKSENLKTCRISQCGWAGEGAYLVNESYSFCGGVGLFFLTRQIWPFLTRVE